MLQSNNNYYSNTTAAVNNYLNSSTAGSNQGAVAGIGKNDNAASKHVKVVIRTRPTSSFAQELIQFGLDKQNIHIHIPKNEEWGYINNQQENWDFKFDKILHNASQETVYDECGVPIVKSLLEGFNATILAYGQTGAGKTFTMTGASENYKHRGLIPRAISHIFREVQEKSDMAFTIRISYLEIYNEQMVDLLVNLGEGESDGGGASLVAMHPENMAVIEEKSGATHVKGLTTKIANSEEEALNLLFEGETMRSIAEHQMNKASSRSHCIFTIYVESRSRVESSEKVMTSKLNLVDLAGSERLSKTETKGVSLKEAMYINRSLTYLEQVIIALADKKRDHIPFRQSKMTHVLRDALGGNCNTLMIANIWGQKEHIEETISTLRFSTRMMCVSVSPEINVHYDPLALIKKYEKEIKDLKQELSMHDTLANRSHVQYEPYTEAQKSELVKKIRAYIDAESEELEIVNIRNIKEMLSVFRLLYKNLEAESISSSAALDSRGRVNSYSGSPATTAATNAQETAKKGIFEGGGIMASGAAAAGEDGVGDVEGMGFGVGLAPLGRGTTLRGSMKNALSALSNGIPATTTGTVVMKKAIEEEVSGSVEAREDLYIVDQTVSGYNRGGLADRKGGPLSRAEEFENFKKGKGQEMSRILAENKVTLKDKKKLAKELAESVNTTKQQIDEIKDRLDASKAQRDANTSQVIMSQEEYSDLAKVKTLKETYKSLYNKLRPVRSDIEYCQRLTDQCRQKLMTEFEQWYESSYGPNISEQSRGAEDVLDIGEKFDRLQMERMSQEDPDSLPFYNAKKNSDRRHVRALKTGKSGAVATGLPARLAPLAK